MGKRGALSKEEYKALKDAYVNYYSDVPVQKYAAMYIGKTEATIINWLKADEEFYNRVQNARASWVKKQALKAKAEFKLERLEKEVWKESIEQTVILPKPLLEGIVNVPTDDSTEETPQAEE